MCVCVPATPRCGDIFPETDVGKGLTVLLGLVGLLYIPYVLALTALRRPSAAEHNALVEALAARPWDTALLGPGYMAPALQVLPSMRNRMGRSAATHPR